MGADQLNRSNVALAMLALAAVRGYSWGIVSPDMRGLASKAVGGLALLAMIWLAYSLVRPSWTVALAASVWSVGELQVVMCSIWYMFKPWFVPIGAPMCSARFDLDLGAAGLVLIAWTTWWVWRRHGQPNR